MIKPADFLFFIALAALIYMPIFGHLDDLTIRVWDESRLAVNAYEMYSNGNYLVTHFNGKPDMWNTKPPLQIWCQVALMHLIGPNELAIRLPSAIAAFLTCILLISLTFRLLKDYWLGGIAVLMLITTEGYVTFHATRTGDYDALLTLLTTASCFCFFMYCEFVRKQFLHGFFIFIALAVLTKGIAGLLFLPGIALYALLRKQVIPILKNKHFYTGIVGFLVVVFGFYLLREAYNPGYLKQVWNNEVGGRYLTVIERHEHEFWYYYFVLIQNQFKTWYFLIPCGIITGLTINNQPINALTKFCGLMVLTYFLVISCAQTKILWYVVPMFPFLAILSAIFVYSMVQLWKTSNIGNSLFKPHVLPGLMLFMIFVTPYCTVFKKTIQPKEFDPLGTEISYYLRDCIKNKVKLSDHGVVYQGNSAHHLFYIHILNDQGSTIKLQDVRFLNPGDKVIVNQPKMKQHLEKHYKYQVLHEQKNTSIYQIYE